MGHRMYIHGGSCSYQHIFAGLYALDLNTMVWHQLAADEAAAGGFDASPACFSHSLAPVGDLLVVAGGCHTQGAGECVLMYFSVQLGCANVATSRVTQPRMC